MPVRSSQLTLEAVANVGRERFPLPRWCYFGEFLFVCGFAGLTIAAAPADHRWLLAGLLAVAVSPWLAESLGFDLGVAKIPVVLVPIGIASIGADAFSFVAAGGKDQVMLFIPLWLVGEIVATCRPAVAVPTVLGVFGIMLGRVATDPTYESAATWGTAVLLTAGVGVIIRILLATLRKLEDAQSELVETAAAEERRRVAREVHDVIAHSLAVTMLHVTAARLAIGRGDPPAADEALDEAERAGRTSLADIRRMVGLLRGRDTDGLASAQPGAGDVIELVDGYRGAGLDVSLELTGDVDSIDPTTGLTLYRIVQESLANACKHAPGAPVRACIDVGPVDIAAVVDNPVRDHMGTKEEGHGLVGIRERTEAMGGECRVGREANRWIVRCKLPLAPVPVNGAVHP